MWLKLTFKFILLFLSVLLLSHCSKTNDLPVQHKMPSVSPYDTPADTILLLAKTKTGEEKQSLLLRAAGRLIQDGQWHQASKILTRLINLPILLNNEKNLLLAKINLIREKSHAALSNLANVHEINSSPLYYQVQFHQSLAQAYQGTGQTAESISERMKLERLPAFKDVKQHNLRALWLSLSALPLDELDTLSVEAPNGSELAGWTQLALISRNHHLNGRMMAIEMAQWRGLHPHHPAHKILSTEPVNIALNGQPKKMALLLPTTGPLAGPAEAIRAGFMSAHLASKRADKVKILSYNTDSTDVVSLYNQALTDGADYIVGPLSKADVGAIAARSHHPVPTLLLNDLHMSTINNAYQFGLSPTNEAIQVAVRARTNGHTRALILAPTGVWGEEVIAAFSKEWQEGGGRVIDTLHYTANEDLNRSIRDFLHISGSEARQKHIKQLLGRKVESTLRRRQDFDMIFILAYPTKARQIMPMLKYYYAGDISVYATSSVYAGYANAMKDRDLDGIMFCDMPWVFSHQMNHQNWPEQLNSYNRLYAIGRDSYALSTQLNQLSMFPAMGMSDKSGVLYLNDNQQIARVLAWGQFRKGKAGLIG